ncbi:MAG: hypothetical protein SGI83_04260 [Bacteroidota bacterium]|nr:hypothetical protein [Bacteroidota bacterium]
MKNFFNQAAATVETSHPQVAKNSKGDLYVAFINKALINSRAVAEYDENGYEITTGRKRESVFSTSGGSYYINGVSAILSQDDEMMLYENELSEYY